MSTVEVTENAGTAAPAAGRTAVARQAARRGTLVTLERLVGLTTTGFGVVVVAIGGWLLAYGLGGKSLYLLVYCAVLLLIASYAIACRGRRVEATRSALPRRMREGQTAE